MSAGKKATWAVIAAFAVGSLAGVWFGYQKWFRPPPVDQNPVSHFNGQLGSWGLRTLPRPSSVIEPGALLSGRLKWLVSRKKAWSNADAMDVRRTPVLASATYSDTRDASGTWRTVLPALGPLGDAEFGLGLTGAQTVETRIEGVDVIEVAESDLDPALLTEGARKYLGSSVVVVREICRIRKLTYRFADKQGRTIGAKLDVAKAKIEGDLSRVSASTGELVLENVCIAFGECDILYDPGPSPDPDYAAAYARMIDPDARNVTHHGGLIRLRAGPDSAMDLASYVETQGRLLALTTRLKGRAISLDPEDLALDVEKWAGLNREKAFVDGGRLPGTAKR